MTRQKLLKVEEVALLTNVSIQTINNWYAFRRMCPDNDYAKLLPEFTQEGERQTRYWKYADVWRLIDFKNRIPKGRNGILGCVTQRYCKAKEN